MLRVCLFLEVACGRLLIELDSVYYTVHGFTTALNINKQYTQRSYNKRTTLYYVPNKQYTRYKHLIIKKQKRNNI